MKKRVLSVFLAALMLMTFLPLTASALTSVKSVALTVTVPSAGSAPSFTVTCGGTYEGSYKLYSGADAVEWFDAKGGSHLTSSDKFVAGHTYRLVVWVETEMDCYFPASSGNPTVTATVNGNNATVNKAYEQDVSEIIEVTYDFTLPAVQVSSVAITGVTVPAAGQKPNFKATVDGTGYQAYGEANFEIDWFDKTNGGSEMMYDDVFVAGHTYTASIWVKTKDGYEFTVNSSNKPTVTATINGQSATVNKAYEQSPYDVIEVTCDYIVAKQKVTSVAISGVTVPVVGENPNYKATVSGTGYAAYSAVNNEIDWYDTSNGHEMMYSDVFEAGHTYRASIWVKAKDGYEFAVDSSNKPAVTATVNGKSATVNKAYEQSPDEVIEVNIEFTLDASGQLDPINFPDVASNAWYYEAVQYCAQRGFITGYKNGKFGPADPLQRQDFVVIIARIAGADLSAYEGQTGGLKDVAAGAYYAAAVAWAVDNDIVLGYTSGPKAGNFGVGDKITREQVATILYRFMGAPDPGSASALDSFPDKAKVSSYASEAMTWAVNNNIISGSKGNLAPQNNASRAEIATIIMRMDQQGMF